MNADVRPIRTAAETAFGDLYEAARDRLPGDATVRDRAAESIRTGGLPHRRIEAWKYTDLRSLLRELRAPAAPPSAAEIEQAGALVPLAGIEADLIVLVNGFLVPDLSPGLAVDGVAVVSLAEELTSGKLALADGVEGDFIRAFNTAFLSDGVAIRVEAGRKLERPLHIAQVQVGEAAAAHTRVMFALGEGAEAILLESATSDGAAHQSTSVLDLDIGTKARLAHVKLQDVAREAVALGALQARIGEGCRFDHAAFAAGSAVARQEIRLQFVGKGAVARVNGIALAGGRRHLDTTMVVDHIAPGCESRELFKSVLDGEARAVFQGRIVVEPAAQKTDGKMMMKVMMLSEGPEADLKPELEIYADDVVCGHGATAGAIDEDLLFYLRSRGIPEAEAQTLMVQAFLGEVLEMIDHEGIRDAFGDRVVAWLSDRG
jgi:Fe-S cluster assembly protein SufD